MFLIGVSYKPYCVYTRLNKSPDPSRQPNRPSAVLVFARSGGGGVICAGDVIAVAGAHLAHDPRVEGRQNERGASQISREKGSGHRRQAATFAERARWTEGGRMEFANAMQLLAPPFLRNLAPFGAPSIHTPNSRQAK